MHALPLLVGLAYKYNKGGGVSMSGYGGAAGGFTLLVVLFILLVIVGASYGGYY